MEEVAFFKCPRSGCSKVESSSAKNFQYSDLDRTHKCSFCHKSTQVRTWLCPCEMPWHLCDTHRHNHNGKQARGEPQKPDNKPIGSVFSRASNAKRKRLRCEDIGDIDAWRENSHKRSRVKHLAKREREIELDESSSSTKVARMYEIVLSRFQGRRARVHSSPA